MNGTGDEMEEITTSIVIPTYNEYGNIEGVVEEILDVFDLDEALVYTPIEIIIVDDGSTDDTREVLADLAETISEVQVVLLRRNFGKSAALATGFSFASGKIITTIDGDGQNVPADIPDLIATLEEGYDCVSGWRKERHDPIKKRVPSAIETWLARFTGPEIHDFGCGLKVYRKEAVSDIELYGENHRYIPSQLHKYGYRITEEPVSHRPRKHGSTKYGPSRLPKGFVDLVFNVFWNRFSTRPLHMFGGAGMLLFFVGGMSGLYTVTLKYVFGTSLLSNLPSLLLTVVFILLGFQLIMFGTLAEILAKLYYQDDEPYRIEAILGTETPRESSVVRGVKET